MTPSSKAKTFRVYGDIRSGNCYKVKLLLQQLNIPHEWVHMDVLSSETRSAEFLAKNPVGKMPTLEISPGNYLTESNAILCYLAEGSELFPNEPLNRARVMQWLFFEQNQHEVNIAEARFIQKFLRQDQQKADLMREKRHKGYKVLQIMDDHLGKQTFFVDNRYSIADISLYAYTHCADEGGLDLSRFPRVENWLARVKGQARHITMQDAF